MFKWLYFTLLFCTSFYVPLCAFDKVVIWGHKLYSHPHSSVHYGFYKAFNALGYPTYWLDNSDDVSEIDFSNSLFLTEGQVDSSIPLRNDCQYILHNVNAEKYRCINSKKIIKIQSFNNTIFSNQNLVKVDTCIYYDSEDRCLYFPWATDLLPQEIETIQNQPAIKKRKTIYWVEPIGEGKFGTLSEVNPFMKACKKNGVPFIKSYELSQNNILENQLKLIQTSYMAPSIASQWQKEVDVIPTSIFKNISAGQMGITNSKQVDDLFNGKIIYNPDTFQLFYDAQERLKTISQDEIGDLMNIVKEKHTYLNRIQTLLEFLNH